MHDGASDNWRNRMPRGKQSEITIEWSGWLKNKKAVWGDVLVIQKLHRLCYLQRPYFFRLIGLKRFSSPSTVSPAHGDCPNPLLLLGSSHAAPPFFLYLPFLFPRILVFCHASLTSLVTSIKHFSISHHLSRMRILYPVSVAVINYHN